MVLQLAQITIDPNTGERRYAPRRTLSLGTFASTDPASWRVVIHDLSETGLRIQTGMLLDIGDEIEVELPEAEIAMARVVWTEDTTYGCEFLTPITKGAVSASLLLSPGKSIMPDPPVTDAEILERLEERRQHQTSDTAVMVSMFALLVIVALFIYALLELPFSIQQ
jgi:hypothetical protein